MSHSTTVTLNTVADDTRATTTTSADTRSTPTPANNELPTVRLCTAGSVDDDKSTFVGRLLHDTKSILSDQYEAVQRSSEARGLAEADLSLLVDGLRAEREQGITIDVAYRYFATDQRKFILADCPGHEQYTRNTVTGMSTADVVILLIDVRNGVVRQTNRHATVAGLLGVPHVVVAVNKIDLVDYDEATFAPSRTRSQRWPTARTLTTFASSRSPRSRATTSSKRPPERRGTPAPASSKY